MSELHAALAAPFDPALVSWRVGSMTKDKKKARALAYLDARDVMRRLDEVCGAENWQNRYPHAGAKTVCELGIKIDGEWIWKANGAGDSDIEAEKGALSDAFKRAAVLWGVGRYLYDIDSPWVEVDEWKQIAKHEHERLKSLLIRNGAPAQSAYKARNDDVWKTMVKGLEQAGYDGSVDAYLKANEAVTSKWPDKWLTKWGELVEQARDLGRAAA